ncbi:MAG: helix-turn-helix domain-containing protein [Pelagimonas sp.]|jgi:transcriptional regulator with XRE-family HTH domain|nr:helix-turn-helix domain-containing protein [Pelagimonas sp.]
MTDLKEKIRHVRSELSLSRKALGEKTHVPEGKVQKIETGVQRADHDFLAAFIRETGADANWLLNSNAPILSGHFPRADSAGQPVETKNLCLAIEAIEEGLDAFDRVASPDIKAGLIAAAYELLEQEGEKATAQIIRLVKSA